MSVLTDASLALSFVAANFGIAMAAKMPMMTTTISNSMRVKPLRLVMRASEYVETGIVLGAAVISLVRKVKLAQQRWCHRYPIREPRCWSALRTYLDRSVLESRNRGLITERRRAHRAWSSAGY